MKKDLRLFICILLSAALACRPVIAIGWNEFVLFSLLFLILLGPPIFKFIQRVGRFGKRDKKNK